MLVDARTLPRDVAVESDICIVGAGAAGITLARELDGQPFRVCLLESGGLEPDVATQSLYEGETRGAPYTPLHVGRLRYFGGTTGHWDGRCRPLDDLDFEARDWVPDSGWPFTASHLEPFYRRAQAVLQLGPFRYDADGWETAGNPRLPFLGDRAVTRVYQLSPPTRFGRDYREQVSRSTGVTAYLQANAVEIETTDDARTVTRIHVACLDGNRFPVTARLFVLAAGGLENPRLLLLSNRTAATGLGNANDVVGRYYMDHPESRSGRVILGRAAAATDFYRIEYGTGRRFQALLTLSPETLRRERLLNCSMLLFPESYGSVDALGLRSIRYLMDRVRRGRRPEGLLRHLRNVVADLDDVAGIAWRRLSGSEGPVRVLENTVEQPPDPENRVTLSGERDRLGKNRVVLIWRSGDAERRTLARVQEIIGEELGRAGLGRLQIEVDADPAGWQNHAGEHHMGATRMHADPHKGVVDADCRVHDVGNLFIAGSSVFPTSGYANPTLTIVALAIRLADHLKARMA